MRPSLKPAATSVTVRLVTSSARGISLAMTQFLPKIGRFSRNRNAPHVTFELHRHLSSNFHHASGRDLEIIGGVVGGTREPDEQAVLPARHAGMGGRLERTAR